MAKSSKKKSYIAWIAWRNLTAKQKKSGLSFMTKVSIMGVAIGVMALMVVLSVMGGFEHDLKDRLLNGQPHLELIAENATAGFALVDHPLSEFEKLYPEAIDLEAFTQADVVMKKKRHISSAVLFGIDPKRDGHLWGFGSSMTEGLLTDVGEYHTPMFALENNPARRPGIVLGEGLAIQMGADIGDELLVLSPQAGVGTILGGGTVSRNYVVVGKFRTGSIHDSKWAVVKLAEGRRFMPDFDPSLETDKFVTGVALNFEVPYDVEKYEKRLKNRQNPKGKKPARFTGIQTLSWKKANKSLLFALELEKFTMGSILMLIVVVAAFSISGTMMMMVFHKRGQVSLLRALGMTKKDIGRLFMTHGFTIGTVGISFGFVAGVALCALIKSFQVIPLPAGVYHLKSLPCKWLWPEYGIICLCAWVLTLVAATYPALIAARQNASKGLRFQ